MKADNLLWRALKAPGDRRRKFESFEHEVQGFTGRTV